MDAAARKLVGESTPSVRRALEATYGYLVEEAGCAAYVKTIYVGFELHREMVAAAYPHDRWLEVALALPDDVSGPGLVDATHLTWRTMPVAIEIRAKSDLQRARGYFKLAVERVRSGVHDVELPQERFMGRERRIADPKLLGGGA
jgi:hypothetical protein